MNYRKLIDHTLLKADASLDAILKLCDEAKDFGFCSVCVNPGFIKDCAARLAGSDVKVCTVIGFPLGANSSKTKLFEAKQAIKDGASEIDVVINVGKLKDKKYTYVEKELANIVKMSQGKALVKVIIETCLLTPDEIRKACKIVVASGADFVKTSTGFSKYGARVEDVEIMKDTVKDRILIKASGGISDFETMKAMINAGASRIGTSKGTIIMEEIKQNSTKVGEL